MTTEYKSTPELVLKANEKNEWLDAINKGTVSMRPAQRKKYPKHLVSIKQRRAIRRDF